MLVLSRRVFTFNTYIVKTGPNMSGDGCSLICGAYGDNGVRNEVLPKAGEFCADPCERSGDGVRLCAYSGSVLGRRSGDPF